MPVTMREINDLRDRVHNHLNVIRDCKAGKSCDECRMIRSDIKAARDQIETKLAEWQAQGCKEVGEPVFDPEKADLEGLLQAATSCKGADCGACHDCKDAKIEEIRATLVRMKEEAWTKDARGEPGGNMWNIRGWAFANALKEIEPIIGGNGGAPPTVPPPKAPADKLVDAIREEGEISIDMIERASRKNHPPGGTCYESGVGCAACIAAGRRSKLLDALKEYADARTAGTLPEPLTRAGIPDPKKIARLLLDSLTGGALSSLLCSLCDDVISRRDGGVYWPVTITNETLDNLKSNLRALGEKID